MVFLFLSCIKHSSKDKVTTILVQEWLGKKLLFPSNLIFTQRGKDSINMNIGKAEYKIFIYIDSIGCTDCKLQLDKWEKLKLRIDSIKDNIPLLFFFHSKHSREIRFIQDRNNFDYFICIDTNDELNKLNHFPSDIMFQTFLLDKDNKVVVIGNPVHNLAVQDLYIKTITEGEATASESDKTTISIPFLEKDLGVVKEGTTKASEFTITNTGNRPLVIKGTTTSCDCTTAETDRQEIPKGESCVLTIHYEAESKGYFLRTVTLYCNAENAPIEFSIIGTVK